jgi:hypothetical protein
LNYASSWVEIADKAGVTIRQVEAGYLTRQVIESVINAIYPGHRTYTQVGGAN